MGDNSYCVPLKVTLDWFGRTRIREIELMIAATEDGRYEVSDVFTVGGGRRRRWAPNEPLIYTPPRHLLPEDRR